MGDDQEVVAEPVERADLEPPLLRDRLDAEAPQRGVVGAADWTDEVRRPGTGPVALGTITL